MLTRIYLNLCILLACPILWFIFLPQYPEYTVTNAYLNQFNFAHHNNTLVYNLVLDITIVNPNRKTRMVNRDIQVTANYRNKMFALKTLPFEPSCRLKKTPTLHHVSLQGQKLVVFGEQEISQFNSETAVGIYSIDLKLDLRLDIFSSGTCEIRYSNPSHKMNCNLKVPLRLSETSTNPFTFKTTRCRNVYVIPIRISFQTLKHRAQSVSVLLGNPIVQVLITCVYIFAVRRHM